MFATSDTPAQRLKVVDTSVIPSGTLARFMREPRTFVEQVPSTQLNVGDIVIVEAGASYGVALVTGVYAKPADVATKWVVQALDTTTLRSVKAKVVRAAEIRRLLVDRFHREGVWTSYEDMATAIPEVAALVEELKGLGVPKP